MQGMLPLLRTSIDGFEGHQFQFGLSSALIANEGDNHRIADFVFPKNFAHVIEVVDSGIVDADDDVGNAVPF